MFGNERMKDAIKEMQINNSLMKLRIIQLEREIRGINELNGKLGHQKELLDFLISKHKKMAECLEIRPVYAKIPMPFKVYEIDKTIICYEPIKKCKTCKREL